MLQTSGFRQSRGCCPQAEHLLSSRCHGGRGNRVMALNGNPFGRLRCPFPPRFESSLLFSDWSYSTPHFLAHRQPANHGPLNTYNSEYKWFACQAGSLPKGVQLPTGSWLWTGPRSQMLKLSWKEEACRFQSLYPKEIWLLVGFRPWSGSWPPDACWRAKTAPGTRDRNPLVKDWSPLLLLKRALSFHQDPPFLPWLLSPLETGDPPPLLPQ